MYRGTESVLVRGTEWVERISRRDMSPGPSGTKQCRKREVPAKSRTWGNGKGNGVAG